MNEYLEFLVYACCFLGGYCLAGIIYCKIDGWIAQRKWEKWLRENEEQ